MTDTAGRVYGGRSEAERRADRRNRLVEAGLELFGTAGWANVTIEQLCASASVATRSFYEEFPSRESLIQAVYDEVVRSASEAVVTALAEGDRSLPGQIAAGVGAYVDHVTEDPRRARVAYREVRAVGGLETHRHEVMVGFAELMQAGLRDDAGADPADGQAPPQVLPDDPVRRRVLTLALAGALSEVLVDWVAAPGPPSSLVPLREELVRLFTVALVTAREAPQARVRP